MKTSLHKKSNLSTNIGIALILNGVPLGMYLSYIAPIVKWSHVLMFLSIALIVSPKNIFLRRLPSYNKMFTLILLFQFLMLFYGFLSDNLDFKYLNFHFYIIFLVIAISSVNHDINFKNLIKTIFIVTSLTSILGIYYLNSGIVTSSEDYLLRQEDSFTLEVFTIAMGAIINFISTLFLISEKSFLKYVVWFFLVIDIVIVFLSTKRTPVFVLVIIFMLYFYKIRGINVKLSGKYVKFFFLIMISFLLLYLLDDSIKKIIDNFVVNLLNGILNILGDTSVKDESGSALYRYQTRLWAYNYIGNEFNLFNYILGAGYMTRWLDNPILQSYLDMGVLGLFLFMFLVIVYPIRCYFRLKHSVPLFCFLTTVHTMVSSYSSGNPYLYIKYTSIVLLAFSMNLNHKSYF